MENTEQQNLALIADMIADARKEFNDRSFYFLLWGWVVSLCCLAQYVLLYLKKDYNGIVWILMIPTAIVQILYAVRQKRREGVKTYIDKVVGYVWVAIGVCLVLTLSSSWALQLNTYPVLIMLYGVGTFLSGSIMGLKPMIWGAIACWVIAAVTFYVSFEYQLLLLPLSLIVSYIIPGYLLKNRFRKNV